MKPFFVGIALISCVAACERLENVGKAPEFTPVLGGSEHSAMMSPGPTRRCVLLSVVIDGASLWSGSPQSLLGDRRAVQRGDILTVVIEIDDKAEISNTSGRSRSGSENLSLPSFFGIPQRINESLPDGASLGHSSINNFLERLFRKQGT